MCRHKQKEREHAKHVVGMGRIDSMMRKMAQFNENKRRHEAVDGGDKEVVDIQVEDIIEVLTYENQEGKVKKKIAELATDSVVTGGGTDRRIGYDGEEGRKVSIQAWTAREWLSRMGYRWKSVSKDVYIDGHEREDVVQYRKRSYGLPHPGPLNLPAPVKNS